VRISHEFTGGNAYGLVSDFGCGSWGLVTCLGGRCRNPVGEVFLNDQRIDCKELAKYSCFISERVINGVNKSYRLLTARKCIEKALQISKLPYSVQDIKTMFDLSGDGINCPVNNGRFNRNLNYVSGEIWSISTAIGFALGKEIFCFPWLNEKEIFRAYEPHLKILKEAGKIVLIPSSQQEALEKLCDEVLIFNKEKIITK